MFGRFSLELACVAWIAVIWVGKPAILKLTVDDSFSYLKTALNVAAGHGAPFDRINPSLPRDSLLARAFTVPWRFLAVCVSFGNSGSQKTFQAEE